MTHIGGKHTIRIQAGLLATAAILALSVMGSSLTSAAQADVTPTPIGGGRGEIVFASNRDGDYEIYLMNDNGSDVRRLTDSPEQEYDPAWSPDGSQIAFVSDRDGNIDIYVMSADGSNIRRLTDSLADNMLPTWSPDGTQIAFMSLDGGKIHLMNVDGTNSRMLNDKGQYPAWSSDGMQIVFESYRDSYDGLFLMDADGTQVHRLTPVTHRYGVYSSPAWSPDGTRIAFSAGEELVVENSVGLFVNIYTMNSDGSDIRRLTQDAAGGDILNGANHPSW